MAVTEGICPMLYSWMFDEHNNYNSEGKKRSNIAHIMCDEMKRKSGIVWNCLSTKYLGFTSDSERGFD